MVCSGVSMLTGSSLLARVRELGSIPRSDLVRACGYVGLTRDGTERLNYTAFYEALLEAKGMHFGRRPTGRSVDRSRLGRRLTHTTKVHFNGNLMVGSAYTSLLDLKPGDTFLIQIEPSRGDRQRGQIRLLPRSPGARVGDPGEAMAADTAVPEVVSGGLRGPRGEGSREAGDA